MDEKDNPRRRAEAQSVMDQATEWLMRLEEEGAQANPMFADWLRESPTHVQAYLRAATLDTMLKRVDPQRSIDVLQPAPADPLPDIEPSQPAHKPTRSWRLAASIAMVVFLSAAAWTAGKFMDDGWMNYGTDIGELRTVSLGDGSTMTLNTNSRVQVRFTRGERELRLMKGEAVFRVERDPLRPFRVRSGDSVVQAIGTEFNMYRKAQETTVSVLEGRVAVMAAPVTAIRPAASTVRTETQVPVAVYLDAGEQIRLSSHEPVLRKSPANMASIAAWRERRLVFVDEPLSAIAYEINRYNRSPKIRVEGAAASRRYAVSLDAGDPESLIAVLTGDPQVAVERRSGEIVVHPQ